MRSTRRARLAAVATTMGTAAASVALLSTAPAAEAAAPLGTEVITNGGFEDATISPWAPRQSGASRWSWSSR